MFVFKGVDKIFLSIVITLAVVGFLVFASAALGILGTGQFDVRAVIWKQFVIGIVGGFTVLTIMTAIHYRLWRTYAYWFFGFTVLLALLTFTPLGREYNGALRWIELAGQSFQPAETLKIGYVLALAAWFSKKRAVINEWRQGLLPLALFTLPVALIMILQRDTDGLVVMLSGAGAIFFATGVTWRHVGAVLLVGMLGVAAIVASHADLRARVMQKFYGDEETVRDIGWQERQSLIAIGSGGVTGRGYGQSIQKFGNLPLAQSDAIFAVFAEETGFVGTLSFIILVYVFFMLRGFRIASHAKDVFGTLAVVGIMTMLMMQISINIAALTAIIPFAGLTLPFVSQGGTSLIVVLATMGFVLSVSKHMRAVR
ncbi:hypothetical protein A3C89_01570 [Candidatus Kaiserbacteria bacterium RIFCSPHIGHO2_02_FULL_50_50]|uniref:Probable peptidoglycan glycosyltransferase FtsW n=1 Tax=Candidatus Kaiserbacteria bacterium RIFCSPHIGHO2_02_FULL_50_50 TaxID=1798492 RepID=A0A1F6DCC7_9BACT|nr:MAG: hypothetical protein A3C89_01570 [Candidatus Kaiserbacteria bacterium RIFCSPHIGHO2_02_FULL_50_50]OGG88143.1 MAG: hypothetical protein A3G62_02605 [Candidatus Kaiserbacteria bacterium RIFCSPLOWO2_12_FULL_50_10]